MKFIESSFVKKMCEITYESYLRYWDERNGGNVSCPKTAQEQHRNDQKTHQTTTQKNGKKTTEKPPQNKH